MEAGEPRGVVTLGCCGGGFLGERAVMGGTVFPSRGDITPPGGRGDLRFGMIMGGFEVVSPVCTCGTCGSSLLGDTGGRFFGVGERVGATG